MRFHEGQKVLESFREQGVAGKINTTYFDGAGFTTTP
jgi:hypothetical protein